MATANESAATSAMEVASADAATTAEDLTVRAVYKRYEGLLTVRTKAIKGKGAWYWAYLEPILLQSDAGLPRAVKLRCGLCDAVFSASNPSRTASEHLKRGTCPNFTAPPQQPNQVQTPPPKPISSIAPPNSRKRSSSSYQIGPLALVDPSAAHGGSDVVYSSSSTPPSLPPPPPPPPQHFVLSGGKEDLGALALLEDSVKKLKSPKASPGPALSKSQVDSAITLLSDWFYESCGSFSFSSVDHPKFRAFLGQVGLPPVSRRELAGARLDARYDDARADADARIRDALFYQVASDGWNPRPQSSTHDALVSLAVNLPNGTTVFRRAVLASGHVPSRYAEEILWETVTEICGSGVHRCAGILADKFKSTALRSLESQNHWMVNLYCQLRGVRRLAKDLVKEVSLFTAVVDNCCKLANLFNTNTQVRTIFRRYQLQESDCFTLLRATPPSADAVSVFQMLDDIVASARPIQLAVHDDSYKLAAVEDTSAREMGEVVRGVSFWTDLEAVHSMMKMINDVVGEMEAERPLVGQCLPMWDDLRSKVKDWCAKFSVDEGQVRKAVEKRFKKNYHPAWAAADLVFAAADDVTTTDVAGSLYTPEIVRSFFPLNGAICLDGHSLPLLAVQLTELSDGAIFLGCSANHAVLDGTSFWHFLNSWSEISRSECLGQTVISRPPILDRWFPDSIEPPVHLPFTDTLEFATRPEPCPDSARECFFHFPARSVKELKARANSEMSTSQISSLQALLAHLWRSVVRARKLEADRETAYVLLAGQRSRTVPPLPEAYFGNSVTGLAAIALAGDVESKGIGWVAWKLNRAVAAQSSKPVRGSLESWCKSPFFIKESRSSPCALLTGSSPRFDVYGNDFGWGRPVAVRSGGGGKGDGRVTVYPGAEEGSMALEVCLAAGVLASLVDDLEFMEAVGSGDSV